MNRATKTAPSFLSTSFLLYANIAPIIVMIVIKPISDTISGVIGKGLIALLIPKMNRILKILDPSTLPITIPLSPFLSAVIDVTSSGKDVPIATMVRPMSASLNPNVLAMKLAPSTTKSEPIMIPIIPIIM